MIVDLCAHGLLAHAYHRLDEDPSAMNVLDLSRRLGEFGRPDLAAGYGAVYRFGLAPLGVPSHRSGEPVFRWHRFTFPGRLDGGGRLSPGHFLPQRWFDAAAAFGVAGQNRADQLHAHFPGIVAAYEAAAYGYAALVAAGVDPLGE